MEVTDASGYPGRADQVFSPQNEAEVVALLKRASAEHRDEWAKVAKLAGGRSLCLARSQDER